MDATIATTKKKAPIHKGDLFGQFGIVDSPFLLDHTTIVASTGFLTHTPRVRRHLHTPLGG